jgi:hypothetical protein
MLRLVENKKMADSPPEPVSMNAFIAGLGAILAIGMAAFGVVTGAFSRVWTYIAKSKKEIWDHLDKHGEAHVRAAELGDLRNFMQGMEGRYYVLMEDTEKRFTRSVEQSEQRTMAAITPMATHLQQMANDLAEMRGEMRRKP